MSLRSVSNYLYLIIELPFLWLNNVFLFCGFDGDSHYRVDMRQRPGQSLYSILLTQLLIQIWVHTKGRAGFHMKTLKRIKLFSVDH